MQEMWLTPIQSRSISTKIQEAVCSRQVFIPVSANVPLGAQTGATPDGRLAHTPVADGVSPSAGKDVNGPTAAANSVSRLDHYIASNGTCLTRSSIHLH